MVSAEKENDLRGERVEEELFWKAQGSPDHKVHNTIKMGSGIIATIVMISKLLSCDACFLYYFFV